MIKDDDNPEGSEEKKKKKKKHRHSSQRHSERRPSELSRAPASVPPGRRPSGPAPTRPAPLPPTIKNDANDEEVTDLILKINQAAPTLSPVSITPPPASSSKEELISGIQPEGVMIPKNTDPLPTPKLTWLQRIDSWFRNLFTTQIAMPHQNTGEVAVDALGAVLKAIQDKMPAMNETFDSVGRVMRFTNEKKVQLDGTTKKPSDKNKPKGPKLN